MKRISASYWKKLTEQDKEPPKDDKKEEPQLGSEPIPTQPEKKPINIFGGPGRIPGEEEPQQQPEQPQQEPQAQVEPGQQVQPEPQQEPVQQQEPEQQPQQQEQPPKNIKKITTENAKALIKNSRGKFFTVTFTKRGDGTTRVMNARLGVKAYLKGGELPYNAEAKGLIVAFDVNKRDYRMIPVDNISKLVMGNTEYIVF